MISVNEYINESIHNSNILNEFINIEAERIINEAFQSSFLSNLAKKIKNVEDNNLTISNWNPKKSFTSIFGPKVLKEKYKTTRLRSVKWSDIKDSDFKLYEQKPLKSLLKDIYDNSKNTYALIISCLPGTKTIKSFFNGLGTAPFKDGSSIKEYTNVLYTIGTSKKRSYKYDDQGHSTGYEDIPYKNVLQRHANKSKYQIRTLKFNEVFEAIKGLDNYVLLLTPSMFEEYKTLAKDREESQKGIVYCDPESLKKLASEQKARYKTLLSEIKEKKLMGNDKELFNNIKQLQADLNSLIEEIMSKDDFDNFYMLDDAIRYVNYAFDSYIKYFGGMTKSKRNRKRAEERGDTYDERWDFDKSEAKSKITDSEEYLNKAKEYIENIKKKM